MESDELTDQYISFDLSEKYLSVYSQKSNTLQVQIPIEDSQETLVLQRADIYAPGFNVCTRNENQNLEPQDYIRPQVYLGYVKGYPNSMVSINMHENKLSGIVRTDQYIYNLGYVASLKKHVLVEQSQFKDDFSFSCEQLNIGSKSKDLQLIKKTIINCSETVEIYIECDYDMYQNFNENVTDVANHVSSLFTEIALLYSNESIPIQIAQIVVWDQADPYTSGSSAIYDFKSVLDSSGFTGHVAQLLTNDNGNNGGIAYVDQLCGNSPYAYSDIVNSHSPFPSYSWDVQVFAHELGHTFGSQHTHDCVWGPNGDVQIDDCGNINNAYAGSCYDPTSPIIPSNGGTVMSYCHTDPVGIDFLQGFGVEPGDLIRFNHNACLCDNSSCETATVLDLNGEYFAEPNNGNGASSNSASHADWFKFIPESDGTIELSSCGEGEDTRVWIWEGNCDALNFELISDDDCDTGNGDNYASEIVSFNVSAGSTYYIEWDDRWSNSYFEWTFNSTPDSTMDPCDEDYISITGQLQDTSLHAKMILQSDAQIMSGYSVNLKAGQSLEMNPGFEVELGSVVEILIEDCDNNP